MPKSVPSPLLVEGHIAYFVKLHLDTVKVVDKREEVWSFRVDGKARPMLVRRVTEANGVKWFRVFHLTTKGKDRNGNVKPDLFPVGHILEAEKESYINRNAELLPENMIWTRNEFTPKLLDRLEFQSVLKILERAGMTQSASNVSLK